MNFKSLRASVVGLALLVTAAVIPVLAQEGANPTTSSEEVTPSTLKSTRTTSAAPAKPKDFTNRVIELTNQQRSKAGLSGLKFERRLTTAALRHSQDMALQDYFSHMQPNGGTPGNRITATGYQWSSHAENIAAGMSTPEAVVTGWMNSPGHRANILNPKLKEIGVGYYFLANDTGKVNFKHYWTQVFAAPR